mmetsp:Transcript_76579/g.206338  ORF Transcript_76579/g.206338 Transcript_76579/m.206338 type:complete len:326 (-) Transcript_76579:434-1411(-)|eukprot:CAMPEP_0113676826 /NCGR_PEP_ID=MMETSP0038_2-20120614/8883_1 /TAXON_ID=2898 /ORGANISM="Cryptomonas paramecium" /LENGTH=325 /DNA_ID=CAMNT_0000593947 /DNA_START=117 /DNA_END=1094 /DNA_ORIENTATION=- /assembly_acc=CAM_ASM_000170
MKLNLINSVVKRVRKMLMPCVSECDTLVESKKQQVDTVEEKLFAEERVSKWTNQHQLSLRDFSTAMQEETESQQLLVDIICSILEEMIDDNNEQIPMIQGIHFAALATFSATYYIKRIMKYSEASPSCVVVGFHYLTKLMGRDPEIALNSCTMQRLLLVVMMAAIKFTMDSTVSNATWAQIGSIPLTELNALELDLLKRLKFRLFISPENYASLAQQLVDYSKQQDAYAASNASTASSTSSSPRPSCHLLGKDAEAAAAAPCGPHFDSASASNASSSPPPSVADPSSADMLSQPSRLDDCDTRFGRSGKTGPSPTPSGPTTPRAA